MRGTECRIFISQYDFSAVTSGFSVETTVGEIESATLTSTVADYAPAMNGGAINIEGYFYNPAPTGEEGVLYATLGDPNKIVAAIFDYQNLPASAYVIEGAYNNAMSWSAPSDGLIQMSGAFRGADGLKRGKLMQYKTARTATGAGAAVRLVGTLTSHVGRMIVFVHSTAGTQTSPLTLKIQSSANGTSGWADEASFSFASPAPGAQGADLATPVGEYFNVNITSMGGLTSATISFILTVNGLTT